MGQPATRRGDLRVQAEATRLRQRLLACVPMILVVHSASCAVVFVVAARSSHVVGLVLVGPVTDPAAAFWLVILAPWA